MATAVSARPNAPLPKAKKPVPPALQTQTNGAPSQSSPSPSLASKRPPTGFAHPGSAGLPNGVATPNGVTPRLSSRRKETQKAAENAKGKAAKTNGTDGGALDRKQPKKLSEPYVRTTSYILRKFRNRPASLVLHLHPSHFRFDTQDGSFSYDSPMRALLEAIRDQVVPADMVEDFHGAGIKFYDQCLIVQVHDHRKTSSTTKSASSTTGKDRNQPFSIHNYNSFLTPSPFVPYPQAASKDESNPSSHPANAQAKESDGNGQPEPEVVDAEAENSGPKIYTTVLFPTPAVMHQEMMRYANMIDHRANTRKQSTMNARTPASAHPQTPASAKSSEPPAKKQKKLYTTEGVLEIEAKLVCSSAPALYLEPADNIDEAQRLLEALADPLHQRELPPPKSRKRTVAELAADEAQAAEAERFMLIMNERQAALSNSTTAKAAGDDAEDGMPSFAARFERFKALEQIKEALVEKKQRMEEAKAQQAQAVQVKARQDQEQREAARLQQQEQQQKNREAMARRQQAQAQQQAQQQAAQQQAAAQQQQEQMRQQMQQQQQNAQQNGNPQNQHPQQHIPVSNQHGHPVPTSAAMTNGHPIAMTQAMHSSPALRAATPHNAPSPQVTAAMMNNHGAGSVPMSLTNSGQGAGGAGSPPRPGSAAQHAHPRPGMPNHLQQPPPSRNGTPVVPNGTPRMPQAAPDMRNVTPTPRMSHASPVNHTSVAATPVMSHAVPPHVNGSTGNLSQAQINMIRQQALYQQQQHGRPHSQGSPPANAQLAAQLQMQQLAQGGHPGMGAQQQGGNEAYQAAMQQLYHRQQLMVAQQQAAAHGGAMPNGVPNGMPNGVGHHMPANAAAAAAAAGHLGPGGAFAGNPHHPQAPHPGQQQQQAQQQAQQAQAQAHQQRIQQAFVQLQSQRFEQLKRQWAQVRGPQMPPQVVQELKERAAREARAEVANRVKSSHLQQQHAHQQQQLEFQRRQQAHTQAQALAQAQAQAQQHQAMINGMGAMQ